MVTEIAGNDDVMESKVMMMTARLVVVVSQLRGNLDDRRENVGSVHKLKLKPEADLATLKLLPPRSCQKRSNIARLRHI